MPASKSLKANNAQKNTNLILERQFGEDETTDQSLISSISAASPQSAESEGQQVIEFYPSGIVQVVKVYSGSSECSAHSALGGALVLRILKQSRRRKHVG